jgi:hypothetical protein
MLMKNWMYSCLFSMAKPSPSVDFKCPWFYIFMQFSQPQKLDLSSPQSRFETYDINGSVNPPFLLAVILAYILHNILQQA